MEVKIISEDLVKPSSPTPKHLRTFNLPFLDQLVSFPFAPIILFYPSNAEPDPSLDHVQGKVELLKRSLSRALARFYPLAGKVSKDGLFIDCDDGGARFVEARVNMSLTEFLTDPDLILLNKLTPCEYSLTECPELTCAANIQANVFRCGGIAVSMCNTHKLHDGTSMAVFLNEWAAFARKDSGGPDATAVAPAGELMVGADLFPVNKDDLWLRDLAMTTLCSMVKPGNFVTRRFLFHQSAIEALRDRGAGPRVTNPTRVEAVSGILWKCVMAASRRKNGSFGRPSTFSHVVNIRKRMNPPLSESSMGNLLWLAIAQNENNTDPGRADGDLLPSLVGELRGEITKVDANFLVSLTSQDKNSISSSLGKLSQLGSSDKADHILCTSWTRFGFYDADFGWGRPVWVSSIGLSGSTFLDFIILLETRSGDGIEAWVTLDEPEMSLLLEDPELRSFASVNPSPLPINNTGS